MSKLMFSYLFKTNLSEFRAALLEDDTDKLCRLLDSERDLLIKQIDNDGNTALLLAIEYASPFTVRLLLEQGALPDQANGSSSITPLSAIASIEYEDYKSYKAQRSLEMAKLLLDHGAYVDKAATYIYKDENNKDYEGKETPLMTAVRKKNLPLVKLLIEKKANINFVERRSQIRPVHYAIRNGDETMFDLLENAGVLCCSLVTTCENNLLHWFCYKRENDECVSLLNKLIEKGCDLNAQNSSGETPLILAAKLDMTNTCRLLLKNGAATDKYDIHGNQAIDLSTPGSECSTLILQAMQTQKNEPNTQNTPNMKPQNTIVGRRRIRNDRRFTIEVGDINKDDTKAKPTPPASIIEEERISPTSDTQFFPMRRTNSEEIKTKYETLLEKLLNKNHKRRSVKNLSAQRPSITDTKNKSLSQFSNCD